MSNTHVNGAWWGENITKITNSTDKAFTLVYSEERVAYLYERRHEGGWMEGEHFSFSRPPNLLIDSHEAIHVIGYEPFDEDEYEGRLVHIAFTTPDTVNGGFEREYISEDYRQNLTVETYATIFVGAAIGQDDTILVAYNNSVEWNVPDTHSIGARIYHPDSETWTYESVALGMHSRHTYPFAFVSDEYFHVYAVEDDYDPYYESAGKPYSDYTFRYGRVTHFQRLRSGGAWQETPLLDLNASYSKIDIWNASLRITDFLVDSNGVVHALLRYRVDGKDRAFHYWKTESATTWEAEPILAEEPLYWARIWERIDGRLFFVCQKLNAQVWIASADFSELYAISDLRWRYRADPTPFVSSVRSGSDAGVVLRLVVYSGTFDLPAVSIDFDTTALR